MKIYKLTTDLRYKQLHFKSMLLVAALIIAGNFLAGYKIADISTREEVVNVIDTCYIATDTLTFSEDNLKRLIAFYDIQFPNIVFAQAKAETNHFKSDIFQENNNLFGFRVHPIKWKGVEMKFTNRGHLVFTHWSQSVKQYKLWQTANFKDKYYLEFIQRMGYAEDQNYINLLNKIK